MRKIFMALPFCLLIAACEKTDPETVTVTETIDLQRGLIA